MQVRITVLDINDNSPTFPMSNVSVSFDESDPPGTRMILDAATDPDEGPNGTVAGYQIISGDQFGRFAVTLDPVVSTILYLENVIQLRRSVQSLYTLNISCHDMGAPPRYGFLRVDVTVTDANDHAPVFDASVYHVVINESAAYGSFVVRVGATDADSGANAVISYSIIDGNQAAQFSIDGQSGVVTTAVPPPLSCTSVCDQLSVAADPTCRTNACLLTVQAQDGGVPYPNTATAQVSIVVNDVNDHPPVISFRNRVDPDRPLIVDAGAVEGAIVEAVSVTDADTGANGQTSARVTAGNAGGDFVFAASPLSGLYFLRVGANRLVPGTLYNLTIQSSDSGTPSLTTSATLLIFVASADPGPPIFDASFYTASLMEISPVGSYVVAVSARSTSANVSVMYLISSGNYGNWFTIDRITGLITTGSPLNWSQRQVVSLLVQASTSSSSATGYANVTISILRGFQTTPQFVSQVYYFSTLFTQSAAQLQLGTVSASVENGGNVTYQFADHVQYDYPDMFRISRSSGLISALRPLSIGSTYSLVVEAVNPLNFDQSTCSVFVNVTSSSSNLIPVIYPSMYFVRIALSLPSGTPFVQVRVTYDFSHPVFYSFSSDVSGVASKFAINPSTGWISVIQTLTSRTVYSLTVMVTDSSGIIGSQRAVVQVFVSGASTGPPVAFNLPAYAFSIVEDDGRTSSPVVGRNVGQVSATGDGSSRISYFVVDGDPQGIFSIGNSTGILSTSKPLDREQQSSYNITVVASTGSDFAAVFVIISITDLNDNVPRFFGGNSTETEVSIDAAIGQDFYVASAVDLDNGVNGTVRYSLNGSSSMFFSIDASSGLLTVAVPLTQLSSDFFVVNVVASNPTTPPLMSLQTVNVFVIASNDVPLMFNSTEIWLSVDESIPVNSLFSSVSSALLIAKQGVVISPPVVFSVTRYQGINDGRMRIFPDGSLYNAASLDSETMWEYRMTVLATASGTSRNRSATLSVTVVVHDINDHNPVFSNVTYQFSISENSPADQFTEAIVATDADSGRNADLHYAIIAPDYGFVVDPISGLLTTFAVFDREQLVRDTKSDTLMFQVSATDNGLPVARSGLATVRVVVVDANDEPPKFRFPVNEATISENATVNSTVIQVGASDPDAGQNGIVSYFFVEDLQSYNILRSVHFNLDVTSGLITVAAPLDAIQCNFYNLYVMAIDHGSPVRLNSTAVVRINVIQTFQRTPVWTTLPTGGVIEIGKRSPVGSLLTVVSAEEQSLSRTPTVYTLVGVTTGLPFALEGSTGKLYLNRSLVSEMPGVQFQITLTATVGQNALFATASTMFRVVVVDYNTFDTPQFIESLGGVPVSVVDGSSAGSTILVARATVARFDVNVRLVYSIVRQYPSIVVSGGRQLFDIDPNSGVVTVTDTVDRDRAAAYRLVVSACNRAAVASVASLTAEHLFTVVVDDDSPEFISPSTVIVPPNLPLDGRPIAVVRAVGSVSAGSTVRYAITAGDQSLFQIDGDTGSVNVVGVSLSSPRNCTYSLTVSATDISGRPQKTSAMQLNVIVATVASSSDNVPVFSRSSYSAAVVENSPASTSVVVVSANYRSKPSFAQIVYYITSISGSADMIDDGQRILFAVDASTGLVTTTRPVDRETSASVFYVQVAAIDVASVAPRIVNTTVRQL